VFFKRIYISIFFFCIYISVNAQLLNFKNYSIQDGLPQSQILDVCQDHTGMIWVATNGGGVGRFDGLKFHNFSTKDGLNNNRVYDVFEDSHQNIWIGSTKGLNKFVNNTLVKVSDTLINQTTVYKIHEHSNGELWLGTSSGIIIFDGKKFREFNENRALGQYQVWAITQDKLGNTWIGTMINGLFCYDGKSIIHFTKEEGLIDSRNRDIIVKDDKIWIATYRGINIYDPSKTFTGKKNLDTLKINGKPFLETTYHLYNDAKGNVWAGTPAGVSKISYNAVHKITRNNGLCNGMVCGIEEDKEGNMWFGSFAGGISKYRNDLFININEKQGLSNNSAMTFFKDSKDNMWIGTWGGGVSKMDYKAWKERDTIIFQNFVQQKDGLAFNNIWSICEDKQGNVWFGTSSQGISVYNGKTFKNYDFKDGLHGLYIHALLCDKKGNIWVAHENGIDKYDGTGFTLYGKEHGIFEQGVNAIYEDKFGNLWFGSPNKITKYDGKRFTSIIRPGGFPRIKNMVIDNLGYMWISTDGGVCVYNGSKFIMITESEGLGSNTVYFILPDDEGYMLLGTNNGIDRLDLNKFVNEKALVLKHYGKEEGFIGLECNQNAAYKDSDGRLWLGTIEGITIYDPKQQQINSVPPQTQITNIRLFLEKMNYSKYSDSVKNGLPLNLILPYDKNHLTFDFIGISHTIPEGVKYKFMLQGFDQDWLPEGKEGTTTYSNLPPGKYVFLLKSANSDGIWNEAPVEFAFEITPPFWKRPWFYIITTLIGFSLIYGLVKIREQNLQRSRRRLKDEVAIRTKELSEEKEKLQKAYSEIDEKNKDITDSIHYAKRIQEAILPPDSLIKQLLPESFVFYKPKDIVSGDFYWLEQWGPQTLIAAVDCTGHGVPGAFMSIVAHNILTQTVNVLGLAKPSLILNETNTQLSKKLNQDPEEATVRDGMDIALCAINYKKNIMEFAGANNPLWIIRNGQVIEVNGDKFPVGAFVGEELQLFTNHEWELQAGDMIYIFTDGFADQFGGPKGKKFKYKSFQELLLQIHQKPMQEQRSILETTNAEWQGDLEQVDDILIIGIKV
jgi:ligand-binding sensor domain-containing protein/serine phosphatase RsbU (regulator of sigma subunit)